MTHQHLVRNASPTLTAAAIGGARCAAAGGFDRHHLSGLGLLLAELGPAALEPQLAELGRIARRRGVAAHAVAAMCDRASPAIVRQRAFAAVSAAVDAVHEAPTLARAS
jgi:hypothetical protein